MYVLLLHVEHILFADCAYCRLLIARSLVLELTSTSGATLSDGNRKLLNSGRELNKQLKWRSLRLRSLHLTFGKSRLIAEGSLSGRKT